MEPRKNIFEVKPKKLDRTDTVTLIAETDSWHYGRVSTRFDSGTDAETVEEVETLGPRTAEVTTWKAPMN